MTTTTSLFLDAQRREIADLRESRDRAVNRANAIPERLYDAVHKMIEGELMADGDTFQEGVKQGWNTALTAVLYLISDELEGKP